MRMRILLYAMLFFLLPVEAGADAPLTAAFVRDHQLWIKTGDQEIQVTKGRFVQSPKWSYDGRFIAYIDGDEQGEKSNLFIYDTHEKESFQPYQIETSDYKWSPIKNQLAYNSHGVLNVTKMKDGRPKGFENVALGVSGFEWFPNGREFIVSSQSSLRPTGWGPVPLYKIPVTANLDKNKMEFFYTIKTREPDLFGIDADFFKWSHDGKWVAFILIPTASWSMDSNTLCVVNNEGKQFQAVGNMLGFKEWMKWAPSENQLAYISGEGRFLVENKKTTIADMPAAIQQKQYTPEGYVDLDLDWYSPDKVIVARSKENKEWDEGPVPTMFTALYAIDLKTDEQTQISHPKKNEFDREPQVVETTITWLRQIGNKTDVWMKKGLDGQEYRWIKGIEEGPVLLDP
ncbi:translocation protein TolB [Mesobacillus selenatarsenatis]|uniref:Translocation protein TolB n=1 Tax=Mesobacillus selenatarsenatis TaxID=388741 RepID=A0A846TCG1_9BACI|nr:translocation protein TolB [Mesobacillus selenatarsenatis]NKE03934.1 translocation protein TolB [Mesobacillus selenatarsenatis]